MPAQINYIKIEVPVNLTKQNYLEAFDATQISGLAFYNYFDKDGMHTVLGNQPTYDAINNCFYANSPEGKRFKPEQIIIRSNLEYGEVEKLSHGMLNSEFVSRMAATKKWKIIEDLKL